jgi:DNA repair protein RadC
MAKIVNWNVPERPREKLKIYGPSKLSNEELVQIMLGCGIKGQPVALVARRALRFIDENALSACRDNYTEFLRILTSIKGVGNQKASRIAASLEFCARMFERQNHAVHDAGDVLPLISSLSTKKQEYFVCITLNGGNRIISKRVVTIGLLDQALVHPREVFADAIKERAAKIIVAHNHPAGDTSPSKEDVKVTENLAKAASILGLEFLDHVIVTQSGYFSFREEGFL